MRKHKSGADFQQIPSWIKQLKLFAARDVLSKLANRQYFYINLLEAPVLAFFIAFMVKYYNVLGDNPSYSFYNNHNVPVYFFMSVVVALFFGLTMSAEEIFRDRKILKRERFLNLSKSSYLISKVLVMFSISAIQTLLFTIVGNIVLEIPLTEVRYWIILFSCSCFANVLGLNISSAFNSAVTIYILIPVLVIPQLLLSGVVISFDKFNPSVGKPIGIPMMGEVMASRWAFEAYMVTQFRDNPFEKRFYELDKTVASADYKRVYYIPMLESKLAYCLNNPRDWRNRNSVKMNETLDLLQAELRNELDFTGAEKLPEVDQLAIGKFDSTVYQKSMQYLSVLKRVYSKRMDDAIQEKENLISSFTASPEKAARYEALREKYVNKAVSDMVKNTAAPERIVEYNGTLIQKIYPIYQDEHRPKSAVDFSASLYQPEKAFLGNTFNTLWFNIGVIWSMTVFLFITLYFDVLKYTIRMLEGRYKYRRKEKL